MKSKTSNNNLHIDCIKDSLEELNQKFMVNPTVKANGNIILFCKRFSAVVVRRCSVTKVFLEISQNSQENICARNSFLIKSLAQMFSCEFCETSINTFFTERLRWLLLCILKLIQCISTYTSNLRMLG